MKFWSCCQRKTSDFQAFLEQAGCTEGKHKWIRDNVSHSESFSFCLQGLIIVFFYFNFYYFLLLYIRHLFHSSRHNKKRIRLSKWLQFESCSLAGIWTRDLLFCRQLCLAARACALN
jgi:hypothetical protein